LTSARAPGVARAFREALGKAGRQTDRTGAWTGGGNRCRPWSRSKSASPKPG